MSARTYNLQRSSHKRVTTRNRLARNSMRRASCPASLALARLRVFRMLTLNLSFLAVGPPTPSTPADVPLIATITVSFFLSANYRQPLSTDPKSDTHHVPPQPVRIGFPPELQTCIPAGSRPPLPTVRRNVCVAGHFGQRNQSLPIRDIRRANFNVFPLSVIVIVIRGDPRLFRRVPIACRGHWQCVETRMLAVSTGRISPREDRWRSEPRTANRYLFSADR